MQLAILQFFPKFADPESNLRTMKELCGDLRADLLVLPELCLTGYQFRDRTELAQLAETADGPSNQALSQIAVSIGGRVVAGYAEKHGSRLYNSAALIGPAGVEGNYRKVHLFDQETLLFDPGDLGFRVFDTGMYKVGIMICFDWIFPESARILALLGADIIAHPANLVLPFCQAAMVTRAIENRVFTATANRIGTEERISGKSLTFTGFSRMVGPDGKVLLDAGRDEQRLMVQQIDPARSRNKHITALSDVFETRRPNQYQKINAL